MGGMGQGGASSSSSSGGTGGTIVDSCPDPTEDITEIALGEISLGSAKPFSICGRTLGFSAIAISPDPNDVIGVARLRNPGAQYVINNFAMAGHTTAVFGDYGWVGAGNPQSDSSDALPVQEGNWRITLGDDDFSLMSADTTIWTRRTLDGQFHGGVVDVNVFLLQGAATQNYVNAVLSKMFPYAGLDLGNVKFYPLDAKYAAVNSSQDLNQLLASSAGVGTVPALNLFVIGSFGAMFGDAIGVAGGIPGSPMKHGTGMSGIAYLPSNNSGYDASVLRHETGHLAGLFHTTEYSIKETDPLSDTVECAFSTMQNNPQKCPDVDNAMFPIAFGALAFTPAQETVIHGSMLYRGILQAGAMPLPPKPVPPAPGAPKLEPLPPELNAPEIPGEQPFFTGQSDLSRLFASLLCAHGSGRDRPTDYFDLAVHTAGAEHASQAFRALALDAAQPELVRRRALRAYLRASSATSSEHAQAVSLATSIAADRAQPARLRLAALSALAQSQSTRASALLLAADLSSASELNTLVRLTALSLNQELRP